MPRREGLRRARGELKRGLRGFEDDGKGEGEDLGEGEGFFVNLMN